MPNDWEITDGQDTIYVKVNFLLNYKKKNLSIRALKKKHTENWKQYTIGNRFKLLLQQIEGGSRKMYEMET